MNVEVKLCEIADVTKLAGFEFTKYISYEETGEIIALRALNLRNGVLDLTDVKRINRTVSDMLPRSKLFQNDILLTYTGNGYGDCSIIMENDKYHLAPNICKITPKTEKVIPYYLYSCIRSASFYKQMTNHMVGSSQPTIPMKILRELKIPLPSISIQRKIAAILSALDEKIATNRAINDNLEQQALSIFYNLFAGSDDSMETELGYIPRTFSVTKVGQLPMIVTDYVANGSFASLKENVNLYQEPNFAYFIRNTDLKADSFGVYVDKHSYEFLSKSTLFGGEIIISNVGDVGSVHLCPVLDRPMTLGNNIIMLRPNEELRYYLYIWFKYAQGQSLIQGIKGGSAQPKFNKTDFKSLPIAIPNDAILCSFSSVVSPMFALINSNKMENNRLIKIRDSILPCLMSGEIDMSEVEF